MRPRIKKVTRRASELYGAEAGFLSIVDRGASETPFTAIKSHSQKGKPMAIKKRTAAKKSHKTLTKKPQAKQDDTAPGSAAVVKLLFAVSDYTTEADVRSALDDAEWDVQEVSITLSAEGDEWIVREDGTSDGDYTDIAAPIEEDGVQVFLGHRKEAPAAEDETAEGDDPEIETKDDGEDADEAGDDGEDDDEDDDDTDEAGDEDDDEDDDAPELEAKSAKEGKKDPLSKRAEFLKKRKEARQSVLKFDSWDAAYSRDSNTLVDAIKSGMSYDQTPPGYSDVRAAFDGTLRSIFSDSFKGDKPVAVSKAAADFAQIVSDLDSYFESVIAAEPEEMAKAVGEERKEALIKWAEDFADAFIEDDADTKSEAKKKTASKKSAPDGLALDEAGIAALVAKSLQPVLEQVEHVSETVEKLASRRPTKKSISTEDTNSDPAPAKTPAKKSDADWAAERQARALM